MPHSFSPTSASFPDDRVSAWLAQAFAAIADERPQAAMPFLDQARTRGSRMAAALHDRLA